jgi:hypothetical protein
MTKWFLESEEKFIKGSFEHGIDYEVNLSPQLTDDPKFCIFSVTVSKLVENIQHGIVFELSAQHEFKIKNKGKSISPKFLFGMPESSALIFSKIFFEKTKDTKNGNN